MRNPVNDFVETEGPGGDQVVQAIVERLTSSLYERWGADTSTARLPEVIADAMKLVERMGKLEGHQKKRAVIGVIVQLVDGWDIGGSMEPMLLSMIPVMIDTLVVADKGKLHIKRPSWSCFKH